MPRIKKDNKKNKEDNKYNADNEIIIGVTTKPKEKVRVEKKKTTRTNVKSSNKKQTNKNNKKTKAPQKKQPNKPNIKTSKISKEEQIRKINKRKIIISIFIVLFIALCGTIYYLTTPVFNIATINVYGNNKNSVDTYVSLSGIKINETNIFAFTNETIKNRIKENSYVEEVKIERKLPNTVELYITERTVDYQTEYLTSYIYLNNQGYILEINEEEEKDILKILGLNLISGNIKEGQRLENEDLIKLDVALKITNYLKYNSVENELTQIDVTDEENYILEFNKEDKIAYIGNSSSITEKMTAVRKILEMEKGKKGKIYADEDALKRNRVYFRED